MFWLPLAMAAGGALMGKKKHERQAEIEDQTRGQRASEQRYSWATGNNPSTQIQHAGSQFGEMAGGALAGGMTGASMGSAFKGLGGGQTDFSQAEYGDPYKQGAGMGGSVYEEMLRKQQQQGPSFQTALA